MSLRARRLASAALLALLVLLGAAPASGAVTVSGTAVRDDWGVTWQECDGVTTNVGIAVGAAKVANVACNATTGEFIAPGVTIPAANTLVTAYFDGALTKGVAYSVSANTTSDITSLVVMQNDVSVRHEGIAATITNATLLAYDSGLDPDVPFTTAPSATSVTGSGVGVHVRGDDTWNPNEGLITDSVDVMPGATIVTPTARAFHLRASGTAPCEFEPGVQRPLCVRPGGTFTSLGDSGPTFQGTGTFAIEARTYSTLFIQGGVNSLAILGTGTGQTLTATYRMMVNSPTTSDPWSPNIVAGSIGGATNNGIEVNSTWTGSGQFTITSTNVFRGNGLLDLPGADVRLTPSISRFLLGNDSRRWSMRNLTIGGTYGRTALGSGSTATSVGINSGGTNYDETAFLWQPRRDEQFEILNVGSNGGDIAVVFHGQATSPASTTWDDNPPWPTDPDPFMLLGTPGANDRATGMTGSNPSCPYGTGNIVYGTSNGNFALWALCYDPYAQKVSWSNIFNGSPTWTWDGGGANDTIQYAAITSWPTSATMVIAGTTGTSEFRVLEFATATTTITTNVSWNNGGAGAEMMGSCWSNGGYMLVGRTGAPGSHDWVARIYDPVTDAWATGSNSTIVWDAGGGSDVAVKCMESSGYTLLMGTGRPGADDDLRVGAFSNGVIATQWGSAGTRTITNAGTDRLASILYDNGAFFMVSENSSGGGRTEVRHIDPDGDVDTTFGNNGVATWDPTGARDAPITAAYDTSNTQIWVGTTVGTNGGDAAVHYLDLMGDQLDAVEPGRTSIQLSSGGIGVEQDLQVGTVTDPGTPIIDAESYDAAVSVGGSMNVRTTGGYRASSLRRLTLAGDLTVRGLFDPSMGRVDLVGSGIPTRLDVAASTTFRDLVIRGRGKAVSVVPGTPVRVLRTLTVAGTSCAEPVTLQSTTSGTPWTLDAAVGITTSLTNLAVQDSTVTTTPLSSAAGRSISGNTNWTLAGCGASTTPPPDQMQVDGVAHAVSVGGASPVLSWRNNHATTVDRGDVELYSSSPEGQVALWRLDGTGADSSGNGHTLTPAGAVAWGTGRFGNAAVVGSNSATDYLATAAGPAFDLDTYTVDAWVRFDPSFANASQHSIAKHCNGGWNTCNMHFWFQNGSLLIDAYNNSTQGFGFGANVSSQLDGGWHHVAATIGDGHGALYVDGRRVASVDNSTIGSGFALRHEGTPMLIGAGLGSSLDDVRILDYAAAPAEIRGYYRTGRRHHDLVWDFDPSNVNGAALGASAGVGVRANVTYGGAPDSIRLDGARYVARARFRNTPGNVWSDWSGYDWFETAQSMTVALPSGSQAVLASTAVAGEDTTGSFSLDLTTNSIHGYTVSLTGPSDAWALSDGVPGVGHEFAGWATPATPAAWPVGSSGFFGLTVLAATGGKDTARWGTGTTVGDFANLKYGWAKATEPMLLHSRSGYDPATNRIDLGLRANSAPGTSPGSFATTLTLSVVPNV